MTAKDPYRASSYLGMWCVYELMSSIESTLKSLRSRGVGCWLRLNGVKIGPGCRFGRRVKVGREVVLGSKVSLEDGCEVHGLVRLGDGVVVQKFAEIAGNVELGQETVIESYSFVSTMPTAHIHIGDRVVVNSFNVIGAGEQVVIGDDCIFAAYVQITDSSHRFENIEDSPRHDPCFSKAITIGPGVWLGSGVKVLMGAQIGEGAIIGAGAVVSRSLPAMIIAVGMPARMVRRRTARDGKTVGTV